MRTHTHTHRDELVMTTLERSTKQMETPLTNYMSLDNVGRSTSKRARELEASPLAPSGTGEGSDSDSEKEIIVPYPPIYYSLCSSGKTNLNACSSPRKHDLDLRDSGVRCLTRARVMAG